MNIRIYFKQWNKTVLLAVLVAVASLFTASANAFTSDFRNETLHYAISYKWGLIHKDAGEATLSLRNSGDYINLKLTAKTKPWADKFYMVRDTLLAKVSRAGFKPVSYQKIAHEGNRYSKDVITYSYSRNVTGAKCLRYREKNGKISNSTKQLSATGAAYDMLSIFYYLRLIDYDALKKGQLLKSTIFSGSKSEIITVRLIGIEKVKLRSGQRREAYHIRFNFTTGGKKKSSADMDTWISTDSNHIPLLLTGSLPIGQVRCYYLG